MFFNIDKIISSDRITWIDIELRVKYNFHIIGNIQLNKF